MGRLTSIMTPEKALQELKKCVKEGRDFIGRGEWQNLMRLVGDIKDIIDYLHTYCDVLTYDKLEYRNQQTNILLHVLAVAREQILTTYPDNNYYGFPMEIDGNTRKKRVLSNTWGIIEYGLEMMDSYGGIDEEENLGIYDKYGINAKARKGMPDNLRA